MISNIFAVIDTFKQKGEEEKYKFLKELIESGDILVLRFLLNPVYNYNIITHDGESSILHSAAFAGRLEPVQLIINNNLVDINHRDNLGRTPIMMACLFGNNKIIEYLLSKGADPNIPSVNDMTVIEALIARRNDEGVELLKKHTEQLNK